MTAQFKSPVILTGPTGVGKTAVALELARRIPLRVISADSMQVYRRMDIGTAKPTLAERDAVQHYCIDVADPDRPYSVAEFLDAALPAIAETQEAGETPLIVGGTRLYIHALTESFDPGPPPNPERREQLMTEAEATGLEALHARLAQMDPAAAARIHPNDQKRIIRAIEACEAAGKSFSELQRESQQTPPLLRATKIALVKDRPDLYRAVEARTAAMIREGWLKEVAELLEDGYGPAFDRIMAHGYRELAAHLQGQMSLEEAVEQINKNVRHYVRYQLGWIRQTPGGGAGTPGG